MILGASELQLPAIKKAKELGIKSKGYFYSKLQTCKNGIYSIQLVAPQQ